MAEMTVELVGERTRRMAQVTSLLQRAGYTVRQTTSPAEPMQGFADVPAQLVLVDLGSVSSSDQKSVCSLCREQAAPPVVVLADRRALDAAIACVDAGAAECIQLPAPAARILQVLARVLEITASTRKNDTCLTESWLLPITSSPAPASSAR